MAASLLFACGLNEQKLPQFVHISEESDIDGNFLISSILGQRLRISNSGTLLVCLQNNYLHYFKAGMRLGYNTDIFLNKTLRVIDPLNKIVHAATEYQWLQDERQICGKLMAEICEELRKNLSNRVGTTILIDNLSILLNLGASKEELQRFCTQLAHLSSEHANLTVITKTSNSELYQLLDNNLTQLSDVHIMVVRLKSGAFREVDGKLLIERFAEESDLKVNKSCKEILYKVNDRSIKIFNPGEIGMCG